MSVTHYLCLNECGGSVGINGLAAEEWEHSVKGGAQVSSLGRWVGGGTD